MWCINAVLSIWMVWGKKMMDDTHEYIEYTFFILRYIYGALWMETSGVTSRSFVTALCDKDGQTSVQDLVQSILYKKNCIFFFFIIKKLVFLFFYLGIFQDMHYVHLTREKRCLKSEKTLWSCRYFTAARPKLYLISALAIKDREKKIARGFSKK